MTLVSAHRCLTVPDIEAAIALGADYVEFDVQRCADGSLVLHHDPVEVAPPGAVPYAEALDLLAGRIRLHLDLKVVGGEVPIVAAAVARLGADQLLVTTLEDEGVRTVREWADAQGLELLVGLSLGRGLRDIPVLHGLRIRLTELFPRRRYRDAGATVVVAHHWLARLQVRRFARRRGLPLLVWTVDTPRSLAYWMRPGRAWLVTTNEPALAMRLRADRLPT
ncbi:glycerophosphodiester phosphodiesterase [Nocardioides mangrovi]|uniref:Glycerophosphodiester phosphodiesterase n=1 Tax=Nocardioides mangrovi TaxID=2874580 RepID=A0ABS7UFZ7_9ACTN|nr:glycerophosphodiester phosphodiesterase [Nocardioides mangrovi]MBZ5739939.1 glycerophosphodiester phosphodiesterase [Nocardioides mangrovi]